MRKVLQENSNSPNRLTLNGCEMNSGWRLALPGSRGGSIKIRQVLGDLQSPLCPTVAPRVAQYK